MTLTLGGHIRKGGRGRVRMGGSAYPAEVMDVRDRVVRLHCEAARLPNDGAGVVLEFDDERSGCVAGYYARVLTASPDSVHELVLLRSASLNREELRTNLRVPADIPLTLETNGLPTPISGKLLNISAGGACIETQGAIGQNGRSRVRLHMTEEPALQVAGTIIHAEETEAGSEVRRIGIRFSEISPEDSRAISWYVWSRVRSFFQDHG